MPEPDHNEFPIDTRIVINRPPWSTGVMGFDTSEPTHRVVGYRADGYLRIRPLNVPDDVKFAEDSGRRISIETYIPADEVIKF